ncbi:MAG TPA: four helix bundle protein [Coleofasciculaceae cyanobacterium]|jgi:four helix bundle protein
MSHREQFIWKKGVELAVKFYKLTHSFPRSEVYGLTSQIRRASVSVPSNIAEGYGRKTKQEYVQFLHIALGFLRELDTQLIIAQQVALAQGSKFITLLNDVEEMQKILVTTINKLKSHT